MTTSKIPDWNEIIVMMFARQAELMEKFKAREGLPDWPLELSTNDSQQLLRNFAWRVTEELTESYHELMHGTQRTRLLDELADVTHYLIEMCLFAGVTIHDVLVRHSAFPTTSRNAVPSTTFWTVTQTLGLAMQRLRTRPWKEATPVLYEHLFQRDLNEAFGALLMLWASVGATQFEMYDAYLQKSNVNHQRLEPK